MNKEENDITITSARKIYELLKLIEKKPEVWLTSKTISSLQDFLNGYLTLGFADDIYEVGQPEFKEFEYWLRRSSKENLSVGSSFSSILLEECKGDEEKAFNKFFSRLKVFVKENH